jgi:hypothetical protein
LFKYFNTLTSVAQSPLEQIIYGKYILASLNGFLTMKVYIVDGFHNLGKKNNRYCDGFGSSGN